MLRALLMVLLLPALLPAVTAAAAAVAPGLEPGVSRTLARWREITYADIRYSLKLSITQPVERVEGELEVRVTLAAAAELAFDWRQPQGRVWEVEVNGALVTPRPAAEHLVIDARDTRRGENVVRLRFESPIAVSGSALTLFRDREDGAEYVYSLLVPADASTVFPCFDQPDLKARFHLELSVPENWTAVSNGPLAAPPEAGRFTFSETSPISTYLFAFAAGPFEALTDGTDPTRLLVRRSRLQRAHAEAREVLQLNRAAVQYFARYFAHPFPFAKYDLVLVPEFPYGGMEHAGATFLREEAILFPSVPSQNDRLRRAQLVFHETCHQWFGDLVTMRWFDDLWLKEGFANFMAAKAAALLTPQFNAWNAFHTLKVAAYRTDITQGTTPIWQDIPNLSAAKSAYGSIVYSKAPAMLRQAEFYLGEATFVAAVRAFVKQHAYAAADWSGLVRAFESASGRKLDAWAEAWVTRRGMPTVRVEREPRGTLRITQQDTLGEGGLWPMRVKLVAIGADGRRDILPVALEGHEVRVPPLKPSPQLVFANFEDWGYGRFLLDPATRDAALAGVGAIEDGLLRALVLDALWDSVREAELAPAVYVELALAQTPRESDEVTVASLLGRIQIAMRSYLGPAQALALAPEVEAMLAQGMLKSDTTGLRITYLRGFMALAATDDARATLKGLLAGSVAIPGVQLSSRDRFRIIAALLARGDAQAPGLLERQRAADASDEGRRYAYAAATAEPSAEAKRRYFDAFLADPQLAEPWIEEALGPFNTVEQAPLTRPHLGSALAALPELKHRRKIFFVNDWLGAFLGGQTSADAMTETERFLASSSLDSDLRLKVLEHLDPLARTVKIRARFGGL